MPPGAAIAGHGRCGGKVSEERFDPEVRILRRPISVQEGRRTTPYRLRSAGGPVDE